MTTSAKSGSATPGTVVVQAAAKMSDQVFFKHYSMRHLPDTNEVMPLHYHQTLSRSLIATYRAFHTRCHDLMEYDHDHKPEEA